MVDKSQSPYFDDYNEEKGFHEILFVPRRPVQVREMNQLQSMIKAQISRFGDHIFENGSIVIPGELNFNLEYSYVKINVGDFQAVSAQLENDNITVTGDTSSVSANLIQVLDSEGADPVTIYVQYLSGGSSDENVFEDLENITFKNGLGDTITTGDVIETGFGSRLTVSEGVFYVNGYFVKVDTQSIVLDKYGVLPSYRIGFLIKESVVTSNDDSTLLDNASGTFNESAPGADRLKVELELIKIGIDDVLSDEDSFVEIFRVRDGNIQKKARGPEYNVIEDVLARRTFDESGDYTVEPFGIRLREHLNDGSNNGLYLPIDGGDESKFVVGIEQGRAYVRGYEVENESTTYIPVDKARDTDISNNSAFNAQVGYFVAIENVNVLPVISDYEEVAFYDTTVSSPGTEPSGNIIGYANVRVVTKTDASFYNLHLFNIRDVNGNRSTSFLSDAQSVYAAGTPAFTADLFDRNADGGVFLVEPNNRSLVFPLPVTNVKSLLDGGSTDTSFTILREYDTATDSSGNLSINAGTDEVFATPSPINALASITSSGFEEIVDVSGISSLGGTPTGKTITINFGAGYESKTLRIQLAVIKQTALQKSKSVVSGNVSGSLDVDGNLSLEKADAFEIVSVIDDSTSNDITEQFTIEPNKNSSFYGVSYIKHNPAFSQPATSVTVVFNYFQHGSGDYFSVDSYSGIAYSDIPEEVINNQTLSMADVLDFRPRVADDGSGFTGTGSSFSSVPVPSSTIRSDVEYYLPRIDKVYVDFQGRFGVKKGEPALNPKEPNDPDDSMVIYRMSIPAFTDSVDVISTEFINNKRYTMRDIGKLENRIENVEYYTVLNNLEKETADQQIVDAQTGLNRFKNGFVADPFVDHSVGDFNRSDYRCSISSEEKELRPEFEIDVVDMEVNGTQSSNYTEHDNLITVPYTEQPYIQQLKASSTMNINPYAVFRWVGSLTLSPNSDIWVDTKYTDPDVTTRRVSNLGRLGQWWRSWVTRWAGTKESGNVTSGGAGFRVNASVSTSSKVVGDRVVDTRVIPYMRSREVVFAGKGLKPNTKLYAFFDDVDVSAHCKPSGGSYGQDIKSDADGNVTGTFRIPNTSALRFRTGTKRFVLIDDDSNQQQLALAYADADYSAKGLLETRQRSILTTTSIRANIRFARRRDPLAQSFYVEQEGGMFITSAEVYFSTKDENAPVTLQIREMVNGLPGPKIVPYSETTLNPSEVSVSGDASAATKFTFSDPVYLNNETEYCIVLLSNSIAYNVYVGVLGEQEINSGDYIAKQPYSGVLFKSENNFTWTADQTKDMKFQLNKAVFDTGVNGVVQFDNIPTESIDLQPNPFTTVDSSTTVQANIPNHGMFVGSQFAVSGAVGGNNIPDVELNTTHTVTNVIDNNILEFVVTTPANDSGLIGGSTVVSDRNYLINNLTPMVEELSFDGTFSTYTINGTSGKSLDGTENPYASVVFANNLVPKDDNDLRVPWVVLSDTDAAANNAGNTSLSLTAAFFTEKSSVSPVIDKNRVGIITASNIINSPDPLDESSPIGGDALSRYVTKPIGLEESANAIRVYLDANKPQGSDILLFYKIGNSEEEIESSDWTQMDTVKSIIASDSEQFFESEYEAEGLSSFGVYQLKIVMVSNSSSNVPRCKNFRGIALGT